MVEKTPVISSEQIYSGKRISLRSDLVDCGLEEPLERIIVEHPGAVVILPVMPDGRIIMVHQYRHPVGVPLLEFPAGTIEKDELPELCASRELIEETNYKTSKLIPLGNLYPSPGFCNEIQYLFYADNLEPEQGETDPGEVIEQKFYEVSEIKQMIMDGSITDSKSISVFYRAVLSGLIS